MGLPEFSVVVPTGNRPEQLRACLTAIAQLDCPRERFEVIVVDDGGDSSLESVVDLVRGRVELTLVRSPGGGAAAARNLGSAHARGRFLVFTDDDCIPARDWLKALATRFAENPGSAVTGRTENALPENVYACASQTLTSYLYAYYNAGSRARFLTSNNLAVPRKSFLEAGGFDASFKRAGGEDRELCDRWLHLGFELVYAPEALVQHAQRLGLRSFLAQHFRYGRAATRFHQRRAARGQQRVRIEPCRMYSGMLRYPFSRERPTRAARIAALIGLSQVLNFAGFAWGSIRRSEPRGTGRGPSCL